MLKNGQTFIKNLTVFTLQDFWSMFYHYSTLSMKWLNICFPDYHLLVHRRSSGVFIVNFELISHLFLLFLLLTLNKEMLAGFIVCVCVFLNFIRSIYVRQSFGASRNQCTVKNYRFWHIDNHHCLGFYVFQVCSSQYFACYDKCPNLVVFYIFSYNDLYSS